MKARALGFTGWALSAFAAAGLILVGVIFYLQARAAEQERLFARAKADYDALISLRLRYREQEVRLKGQNFGPKPDLTLSPQAFLEQKAREAGLPTLNIREEATRGGLKERAFTVTVNAAAGAAVPRRNFIRFLDLVEAQRPGFKSKNISFKFQASAPDDLQTASATFSDYDLQ